MQGCRGQSLRVSACGGDGKERCNCHWQVESSPHGGELCRELKRWASFFLNFFLRDLAARTRCSRKQNRQDKHRGKGGFIVSRRPRLEPACAAAPSRQENNPAETVATARRIRRAPPAQSRGGADSEAVRSLLQNRA